MSDHDARFAQVERCWHDKLSNYYDDMAKARTAEQAVAVEASYHAAERAYNDAVLKKLLAQAPVIETTYVELVDANGAVEQLRRDSAKIADLLKGLAKAAALAAKLVMIAG